MDMSRLVGISVTALFHRLGSRASLSRSTYTVSLTPFGKHRSGDLCRLSSRFSNSAGLIIPMAEWRLRRRVPVAPGCWPLPVVGARRYHRQAATSLLVLPGPHDPAL